MPKYLMKASYSVEGAKGLISRGGTARREAVEASMSGLGGKVESFYFAFGEDDVFILCDLPDHAAAAAFALTADAAGGLSDLSTTVLLTPEEVDEAAKRHPDYLPPGG
jgi:uncharacterized protein with GYD domain